MSSQTESTNPCMQCGACCHVFRVSFYWAEADDSPCGQVPIALTEQITPHLRAMRGTHPEPRGCVALEGKIGQQVACSIYPLRPTPCREFSAWQADGSPDPACTRARQKIGLPPLLRQAEAGSADARSPSPQ